MKFFGCLLFLGMLYFSHAQSVDWGFHYPIAGNTDVDIKDMFVDQAGNTYLAGNFSASIDFDPGPSSTIKSPKNAADGFVVQYDSTGQFNWVIQLEADSVLSLHEMTVTSGNIYVKGWMSDSVDFDPSSSTNKLASGWQNPSASIPQGHFMATYSLSGAFLDAFTFDDTSGFIATSNIAVLPNGNIVASIQFNGDSADLDPTSGQAMFYKNTSLSIQELTN